MRPRIELSAQIKLWVSVSHEPNGYACKMEAAGGMVLFSKFSISLPIFFSVTSLGKGWASSERPSLTFFVKKSVCEFHVNKEIR